jgi:HAE1 family hydrophobic/amphiphilic exporter-1
VADSSGRHAVVLATSAALLLAGALAVLRLPLATRSAVELPRLTVSAAWPGAAAELVETFLSSPIEAAVQPVRGVRKTSSESLEGVSRLTVELEPRTDLRLARLGILERLELLRADLPRGATPPSVSNYVPEELAERPLLQYSLSGPLTAGALTKLVDERIAPRVSAVAGVAGVQRYGETIRRVAVRADPVRLRQLGVAPAVVQRALAGARVVQSVGAVHGAALEVPVLVRDEPATAEALLDLPLPLGNGRVLRLGDVAVVRQEEDAQNRFYRLDGRSAISLTIARQPQADAIRTAAAVRAVMDSIRPTLTAGTRLKVQSDESTGLSKQLADIGWRTAGAVGLTVLVLLVLLRRMRGVAAVLATSVVALAATALSLYVLGIPANLLTLAGLGMGLGILVQDPLIVAYGYGEGDAEASSRLRPAVFAATLTTAVVLLPFLYLQGDSRAAFLPFAAGFGLALLWAMATALLLLPALAGTSFRALPRWPRFRRFTAQLLIRTRRWRFTTVVISLAALGGIGWLFWTKVPRNNYADWYGARTVLSARLSFPRGSDPRSLDEGMREFERIVVGQPGVEQVTTNGSRDGAYMSVVFDPVAAQTSLPWEMQEALTQRALTIGGASVGVYGQGPGFSAGGSGGAMMTFRIKILGYSYAGVERLALDLQERLERIPRVREVDVNAGTFFAPSKAFNVTLQPDRAALGRYALTAEQLAAAVSREVQGPVAVQRLVVGGEELDVAFKTLGAEGRTLDQLRDALVVGDGGDAVRMRDVAEVGERSTLGAISREDQQYVRVVSYDFRGPSKLAQRTHKAFMLATTAPPGYVVSDDVFSWQADESHKGLWLVGGIGVLLVVLAVAFVYDSMSAAMVVLVGVPVALAGVAAAFLLAGATFTREAAVGVVLVVGLSVHQSVLMVDALLGLARRHDSPTGRAWTTAAVRAALRRSGMVTGVTVVTLASLIPMAVGDGADALSRWIALATAGGTVGGWGFALVGVPLLLNRRRRA